MHDLRWIFRAAASRRPAGAPRAVLGIFAALAAFAAGCGGAALELAGTTERRALELAAPMSELIVDLPIAEGGRVEAGQVVVQLDTEVWQAELRAHEAARGAAAALLAETEGELGRQQELRRSRVATPQALDAARRQHDEAAARVAERDARIAQVKKRLADLTVRAPVAGVVDQLPFDVGERAPAGGVVAVVLADQRPWVRVWMPARSIARLAPGDPATVEIEGLAGRFQGKVEYLARESEFTPHYALTERESAHLVYEARIVLEDAPAELRPGLPARVELTPPAR